MGTHFSPDCWRQIVESIRVHGGHWFLQRRLDVAICAAGTCKAQDALVSGLERVDRAIRQCVERLPFDNRRNILGRGTGLNHGR